MLNNEYSFFYIEKIYKILLIFLKLFLLFERVMVNFSAMIIVFYMLDDANKVYFEIILRKL